MPNSAGARYTEGFKAEAVQLARSSPKKSIRQNSPMSLEAVMNSVRNGLGMRETEITREPSRLWNPHSYAIFAQVHNTL